MADEYVIDMGDSGVAPGYCLDCGEPLPNRQSKRCADCRGKTAVTPAKPKSTTKKTHTAARRTGTVTVAKASGSFAKLFIILSAIWAYAAVKRYGIPDLDGSLSEELAFTDEEAADIARPIGRFTMSNSTTAKIVGPIVENDDLIDAAFAIWEWQKRINQTLAQYRPHQIQDNQRQVSADVAPQQNEAGAGDGGGFGGYDPIAAGYDANRDARVV